MIDAGKGNAEPLVSSPHVTCCGFLGWSPSAAGRSFFDEGSELCFSVAIRIDMFVPESSTALWRA